MYTSPKKQFGQNFLTSIPARNAIVEAGELVSSDTVLEVGPGKGFLTKGLLEKGARVIALEKDRDLLPLLRESFSSETASGALTLLEGDVLDFDPAHNSLRTASYKLIANIPYYITGAIISRYLSEVVQPSVMVILIQKEVAERIVARDGKETLLSLSVKVYGDPKIVYRVSRGSFFPAPKVDSAVLKISTISRKNFLHTYHESIFFRLIHAGFAHKRKFALSNIKEVFKDVDVTALFKEAQISEKIRAEDVTLQEWLTLSSKLVTHS
ncbi:MAG: dimethyladenosine transferase, rRNA (adenine1518-N6/adenine1519-N6)-dimethyltransferase [Candidatus Parcubacteria bacterium]|jgi:16S rRNA (adenine1518-N6/adenine1519-N6)-dimethyltransferase